MKISTKSPAPTDRAVSANGPRTASGIRKRETILALPHSRELLVRRSTLRAPMEDYSKRTY